MPASYEFTAQQTDNFWSHFPGGLPYGELLRMRRDGTMDMLTETAMTSTVEAMSNATELLRDVQPRQPIDELTSA